MDLWLSVTILCLGAVGLMLVIVGSLFSAIHALGKKQYVFGWLNFLFLPAILYCALHWRDAQYPARLTFGGLALLLVTGLLILISEVS
ncbi:hypothetical protein FE810_03955 [Thalassotalea litorea]|uniref:Uncharacterized protein n=1 Tax=Thalassotalea litorea TaxID=2020715 RepID=A0A5R9IMA6_9GAMM|nr:hypothetical protein [Thalassotalea litorea]TLU66675.1 hypothetical protein FE810_03955 [Thalassotalea litorea]